MVNASVRLLNCVRRFDWKTALTANRNNETIEEVRVIVSDTDTMTNIVNAFHDAGIAAFGDYREYDATHLARDAILDGVEYLVFADQWHLIEVPNCFRKCDDDLLVRIRIRHDEETKTMSITAAIKMILERRFQRKR